MSAHLQSDEQRTARAANGHPVSPRGDVWFLVILFVLAGLATLLWLADPSHAPDDRSRVPWPAPKPQKP
jgi:hypothetical protein